MDFGYIGMGSTVEWKHTLIKDLQNGSMSPSSDDGKNEMPDENLGVNEVVRVLNKEEVRTKSAV